MIPQQMIYEALMRALRELKMFGDPNGVLSFSVEHPKDETFGDYSTNIAMVAFRLVGQMTEAHVGEFTWPLNKDFMPKSPRELAEKIVTVLQNDTQIASLIDTTKISVAGPGFINFWLTDTYLHTILTSAGDPGYGTGSGLAGQRIVVEYTDPNPFKEFHIGHLMSNTIGESIARLIEAQGATVVRANYQGDVGLHVAKAVYGLLCKITNNQIPITKQVDITQINKWIAEWSGKSLNERQQMMGQAYAVGATAYEEDEAAKAAIHTLNKEIYDGLAIGEGTDPARMILAGVMALYQAGRRWSLEYFETIYARLGTHFDEYFFESEAGPVGLAAVEEALQKGILELGESNAVVYKGEKEGLHTRVFRNALGLATYEGKELGLAKTKYERTHYDASYIVTANEITEYFKVLLCVMRQLYPELAAKTTHVPHGVMKLPTGKMSSRTGKVVTGEGLLNELKEVVLAKMGERHIEDKELVADKIAVGALKYTVLRQQIGGDIVYDPAKMTNLEGDTGPYIQYTYARAESVLRKANNQSPITNHQTKHTDNNQKDSEQIGNLQSEEVALLRWLYRYPEVVAAAGQALAPHLIATYVYELAARFNTFYNKHQIIAREHVSTSARQHEIMQFRVELTEAVAQVLASGLGILGIAAPGEM